MILNFTAVLVVDGVISYLTNGPYRPSKPMFMIQDQGWNSPSKYTGCPNKNLVRKQLRYNSRNQKLHTKRAPAFCSVQFLIALNLYGYFIKPSCT